MKRFMFIVFVLLAVLGGDKALASGCVPTTHEYKNCRYESPSLKNGEAIKLKNNNLGLFSGEASSRCLNGTVYFSSESCAPIEKFEGACGVNAMTWHSEGGQNSCAHPNKDMLILNGQSQTLYDEAGAGKIDYQCTNGSLQVTDTYCATGKVTKASPQDAIVKTQSVNLSTASYQVDVSSSLNISVSGSRALELAEQECLRVSGLFSSSGVVSVDESSYRSGPTGGYVFSATCSVSVPVETCSSGLEAFSLPGTFSTKTQEFSGAPTRAMVSDACDAKGYAVGVDTIHSANMTTGRALDEFTVLATCKGNNSLCAGYEPEPEFSASIVSVKSCTSAIVEGGLMRVNKGTAPGLWLYSGPLCSDLGFASAKRVISETLEATTDNYEHYSATVECVNYQDDGSNPLMPSCAVSESSSLIGPVSTSRLDCNRIEASGLISGKYSATKRAFVAPPSNSDILAALCHPSDYTVLDSVTSIELVGIEGEPGMSEFNESYGVISSDYLVTAVCSGYQGLPMEPCSNETSCYGYKVPADSDQVKICDHTGQCYLNTCVAGDPELPECNDCDSPNFEFVANDNTCNIEVPLTYSGGGSGVIDFFNDTHSGTVEFGCQDGSRNLHQGSCFKNCEGGVAVQWEDARGANMCGQTVPAGTYRHGDTMDLGSSLDHTGNASIKCNDGVWEVTSGSCLLDCEGEYRWGEGNDNLGQSKVGACSDELARIAHGDEVTATSSIGASGTSLARCDDGTFVQAEVGVEWVDEILGDPDRFDFDRPGLGGLERPELSTCNVNCDSGDYTWGACSASDSGLAHGSSAELTHSSSDTSLFSDWTTGSVTLSCDDGEASLSSKVCNYVVEEEVGAWNSWRDVGDPVCTTTPDAAEYDANETFTQTTTCEQDQRRARKRYLVWNNGDKEHHDTDRETRVDISVSESSVSGTKVVSTTGRWLPWSPWREISRTCDSIDPRNVSIASFVTCTTIEKRDRNYETTYSDGRTEITNDQSQTRETEDIIEFCLDPDTLALIMCS